MMDVGGTSGGGVKGRKWGPKVSNACGLVIHGVSCNQGVAVPWSQARRLRVGVGNTVVGMRWLLSWERRLQRTVSSVVVYFDRLVNVGPGGLVFGGWSPLGKTHFWIFRQFSWIFVDFLDFLDFLDFNSIIQTEGFSAGLSADLDFNPAKVSFARLKSILAT